MDKNDFSDIEDWDSDLLKQNNNDNQTPKSSPKSISTSETHTPQSSNLLRTWFGNQITLPSSEPSEEGQNEDTFDDSLEDVN